jgi:thioredoxin 1
MIKAVKFSASWCNPCKTLTKVLEGKSYEEVDIEDNMEDARRLGIRNVPTLVFFKNDKEVERVSGVISAEKFDEIIEKYS